MDNIEYTDYDEHDDYDGSDVIERVAKFIEVGGVTILRVVTFGWIGGQWFHDEDDDWDWDDEY